MRYLKYLLLLAVVAMPAAYSQAQVSIRVHIGPDYGLYNPPPVCEYGYYPDYPFGCAPYGYWGPEWFADGVFIGAGPWYRFYYTHPQYYQRYYYVRPHFHDYDRDHDYDRVRYYRFHDRDHDWDRDREWHHDHGWHRGWDHDHGKHRGWDHDHGHGHDRD